MLYQELTINRARKETTTHKHNNETCGLLAAFFIYFELIKSKNILTSIELVKLLIHVSFHTHNNISSHNLSQKYHREINDSLTIPKI